jgi:hypothetical protein
MQKPTYYFAISAMLLVASVSSGAYAKDKALKDFSSEQDLSIDCPMETYCCRQKCVQFGSTGNGGTARCIEYECIQECVRFKCK